MKKIQIILILLAVSLLFSSCARRFSPMYYYNKKASSSNSESDSTPSDIAGDEDIPEDQDPFKNGQWNDIGYQFDGNKILDFLFAASFDNNNVPMYSFFKDGTVWTVSDTLTAENKYNAQDGANKAQGYKITGASFYRYDYKNPLVTPESAYNQSERMGRFLFYRIIGKAVVVSLNNYLIAVDTHSKLVFAYAKITKTAEAVGQKYPTEFEAVELHGEKRKFYEYDPIGFMSYDASTDSLKLTLYREYQNEMAKDANAYFPQIHDPSREIAGYNNENSAGRSPYYMVAIEDIDPQTIIDQFKGKTYAIRDKLTLYTYEFSSDGLTLTLTANHFYDGIVTKTYTCSKEVTGPTSLKYGDLTITGLGTYDKIKDGTREYILNYQDNGPAFVDRTAGKSYKSKNGTYEYRFNPSGTSLDYYENNSYVRSYTFAQEDSSDRAVYKEATAKYWGLRLADYDGVKDGVLYWSGSSWASPETTPTDGVTSTPGYLNVNVIEGGFINNVKDKTYKYRDYSEYKTDSPLPVDYSPTGKSLILYTYKFSSDAQTLDITEDNWNVSTTTKHYKIVSSEEKSAIYKDENSGETITMSIQTDNNTIYKDGVVVGTTSFIDNGPLFADRVKMATFKNVVEHSYDSTCTFVDWTHTAFNPEKFAPGSVEFKFNDDGSKFTVTLNNRPYEFKLARYDNDSSNNFTAVYECINGASGTFGNYSRISLVDKDGYKTIRMSLTLGQLGAPIEANAFESNRE